MKTHFPNVKYVIFDLDDTLYLEREYVKSGFKAVAGWLSQRLELESSDIADELNEIFCENERCQALNVWLDRHSLNREKWLSPMLEVYRNHTPRIALDPDIAQMLASMRTRYTLGLITDGRSATQRAKISALAIGSFFDSIVISDELGPKHHKPHVMPYEKTLENLSCLPSSAIYIADNPLKDFVTPRRLGMSTIRVRHPRGLYFDKEPPDELHAPEVTVSSTCEIGRYLALN